MTESTLIGKLYIVSTPIGNLEDITQRALRILAESDVIAAEDTRRTRKLLTRFNIRKKILPYHDFNEKSAAQKFIGLIRKGLIVALVTDGGTPCVSDPGYNLISRCFELNIPMEIIPGVSAVTAAVAASGLPVERYVFEGFLPKKSSERKKRWKSLAEESRAVVLFEAPHRMQQFLDELEQHLPQKKCAVCRELTKIHAEIIRGFPGDIKKQFAGRNFKGEFTIVIQSGKPTREIDWEAVDEKISRLLKTNESVRNIAEQVSAETHQSYRSIYRRILEIKSSATE